MANKQIFIYPVPWDITTTFHHGTAQGPEQIQAVFHQLDETHPFTSNVNDLVFESASQRIVDLQSKHTSNSRSIIDTCNQNKPLTQMQEVSLKAINQASEEMNHIVYSDCLKLLDRGPVILCGGEHGVGVGYIRALAEQYDSFGVLQIDAHMDCRLKYFGYDYSHASVMTHYSTTNGLESITQVGIRDYDVTEIEFQQSSNTVFNVFKDYDIHKRLFEGDNWRGICKDIIKPLPNNLFISLDIDGLSPELCPGTGTPVPGGISFNQCLYLLEMIFQEKSIIGAEVVEICNDHSNWGATVGARFLSVIAQIM